MRFLQSLLVAILMVFPQANMLASNEPFYKIDVWLGKEKFFHDLNIYTIDQFRSDYEEWKKANNHKKFDVQGHDNFESHLLLSTGLFLKNREYLGNKDYYEKYFDKLEDMDDDTSYFFINQKSCKRF